MASGVFERLLTIRVGGRLCGSHAYIYLPSITLIFNEWTSEWGLGSRGRESGDIKDSLDCHERFSHPSV